MLATNATRLTATATRGRRLAFDWQPLLQGMTPRAGSVAFSRASAATYLDAGTGLITSVLSNVARIEADGLLIEPADENMLLHSDNYTNAAWTNTNIVTPIALDGTDGLMGTNTMYKLRATTTNGNHHIQQSATRSLSNRTFTLYAHVRVPDGGLTAGLAMQTAGGSQSRARVNYDVASGTLVSSAILGSTPPVLNASGVQLVTGGVYRLWLTATLSASDSVVSLESQILLGNAAGSISFAGNNTNGVHVGGVQLDAGDLITSYIPTTTARVSRAADVCTITIPTGVNRLRLTYGDLTADTVSVTPGGTYVLPASTKKYRSITSL